jgi:alkylation response protein AidB-like acyl-CoA dehydrogenase
VDFGLTDEQELLRKTAREFVRDVCPPVKAKEWDEAGEFPEELFRGLARMDWFSLPFPEHAGGGGGGPIELALLAEELGRSSFDIAMCFIGVLIPALTVFKWGTDAHRQWIRDKVMTGAERIAVAISEPDSGSDAAALRTTAIDQGDHFVVNGQKAWCTGGGLPGVTIATYVRTGPREPKHRALSLLLIDPTTPGVEIRRTPTLARHILGTNEVYLHDVNRGPTHLLTSHPQPAGHPNGSTRLSDTRLGPDCADPAVNDQPDPGDTIRFVASQPEHGVRDVLRAAGPTDRDLRLVRVQAFLCAHVLHERGRLDRPRYDRVDPNVVRSEFQRRVLHQLQQCGLRGAVGRDVRNGAGR